MSDSLLKTVYSFSKAVALLKDNSFFQNTPLLEGLYCPWKIKGRHFPSLKPAENLAGNKVHTYPAVLKYPDIYRKKH